MPSLCNDKSSPRFRKTPSFVVLLFYKRGCFLLLLTAPPMRPNAKKRSALVYSFLGFVLIKVADKEKKKAVN